MPRKKPDWLEIRQEYIESGLSMAKLAKKHNVSLSTLKKKAAKEKWTADGRTIKRPGSPYAGVELNPERLAAMDAAVDSEEERLQRYLRMTDAMAKRIEEALEVVDVYNSKSISELTKALRDLREIQGLTKTALDIEEQRARIEKLRKDTKSPEESEGGGVLILPEVDMDSLSPPEEDEDNE